MREIRLPPARLLLLLLPLLLLLLGGRAEGWLLGGHLARQGAAGRVGRLGTTTATAAAAAAATAANTPVWSPRLDTLTVIPPPADFLEGDTCQVNMLSPVTLFFS
jgi:hypothetical protein